MSEQRAFLSIRYERQRPQSASPTYLAYGVTRRVELPAGIVSLSLEEQLRVIGKTITDRNEHYARHLTLSPFGSIVGYGYHRPNTEVMELDREGKALPRPAKED